MGIQETILKKKFMLLKSLTLIVLTWWDFADHVGMPFILVIGQRALHEYSPITEAFDVHFLSIVGQLHTFTCSKGTIKIHTETRDLGERERREREIELCNKEWRIKLFLSLQVLMGSEVLGGAKGATRPGWSA